MNKYKDIYAYIESEETAFENPVDINGWQWSFKQHVKTSFFYKHGRLLNGNDDDTPVKNITRPILNLQYRAEDIDVKDIVLYVDDPQYYHLSFLVKKYHDDVFVVENDLDTFFDEIKESKIDFGGGIAKRVEGVRPEVMPLQSIAFCDQTDLLSAPIAFKHFYSPDQLKDMEELGWGKTENGATIDIDRLITLSEDKKTLDPNTGVETKTTGAYIEVYEVHGTLPNSFLDDKGEATKYTYQMQICAFYKDDKGLKTGVTLFKKKQKRGNLKLLLRDKVYSRALGFGGAEEIFENQVWTNYDTIRKKELLDAAAKVILTTDDPNLASRHPSGLKNLENLEIVERAAGTTISQIDNYPRNVALFDKAIADWENHAQRMGAATDALLGESPTAGTPFKLQDLVTAEGKGLHEYRRGKFAKWIEGVYTDWFIPDIGREITKGKKFLSELSTEDMQYVVDCVSRNEVNKFVNEKILNGELIDEEEKVAYEQKIREDFARSGNKKFLEILAGEFKSKPLRVKVNVKGKQKDLARMTDKLVNIFRQIIANPQGFMEMMKIPSMSKTFNEILEYSGLSPVDFAGLQYKGAGQSPPQQSVPSPLQPQLAEPIAQ